ncbi:hypothetical protein LX32DRAFT_710015 [Colletotrichum zoysiae]|uniref:Uncharacterized protein n=1 Tax=Colletotrichum zoysiae TaxID=1216348 RepID=A0AAD9LVD1_9PEZI|nr:hypothetical protein LX32DRAFT_710015 [Colletotrichum zoysiae]
MFRLVFFFLLLISFGSGGLTYPADSGSNTTGLEARDDSSTYTLVNDAAQAAGKTLKDGKWYYFMLCQISSEGTCVHYMFLAGQVSITSEGGNFWGEVWHVRWEREPDEKEWTLGRFNFARRANQAVFWGGQTTESKVSESNLQRLTDKWLAKYRHRTGVGNLSRP